MSKLKLLKTVAMGGAALYGAWQLIRSRRAIDFAGRVVVITGGSRGLGLILARFLADEGAKLALIARDESELQRAKDELQQGGAQVLTISCDVTNSEALRDAIEQVAQHYGALDVLINNAGSIAVGPIEHNDEDDFRQMMDLHCWAALNATRAALPHLKNSGGRVVNIASLGGLITMPHLSSYSVSKFALVGLSGSLRAELAKDGVLLTTVCPGTIRTGSHMNAKFKGHQEKEYQLFSLAAGLPVWSGDARMAARQIVEACRHGDAMVIYPKLARLSQLGAAIMPNLTAEVLGIAARYMPSPAGEKGDTAKSGWESRGDYKPSPITQFADQATNENNELVGHAPLPVPAHGAGSEIAEVGPLNGLNGKAH